MGRPFIVIGDRTDHGGVVVGSSQTTDTHGKRIARIGDQVTCPKKGHGGTTVIVSGDPTMIIDGQPAARHGDKCACGATLISSQAVSTAAEGGAGNPAAASAAQAASAAVLGHHEAPRMDVDPQSGLFVMGHDQFFSLTDEITGEPLTGWKYKFTCGASTVEGVTGDDGMTKKIAAPSQADVKIELLGMAATS